MTLFKRILCFYMAFQVLLASSGFAMYEHWCLMRGSKTVSLVHKETCSIRHNEILKPYSKECTNSIQRSKCCAEKVSLQKIQTPSAHGHSVDLVGQYGGLFWFHYLFIFHPGLGSVQLFRFVFRIITVRRLRFTGVVCSFLSSLFWFD